MIELVAVVNRADDANFRLAVQTKAGALDYGKGEEARSIARAARKALRRLVEEDREPWKQTRRERAEKTQRIVLEVDMTVHLSIGPDGIIQKGGDFFHECFLPALIGKEVQRIRICPMCDRLFVAIRIDQPCCSYKCNNLRSTRKARGKLEEKQS